LITIKTRSEIDKMRFAAGVAAKTFSHLNPHVLPGRTTQYLDQLAESYIRSQGCIPAFKHYKGFSGTCCMSVNDEAVHCLPSEYVLKEGDVLKIDLGADFEGWKSDTAKTYIVGTSTPEVEAFVKAGYDALRKGIEQAVDGKYVHDISSAVQEFIRPLGYGIVEEFVGHGIGKNIHEDPKIPCVVPKMAGAALYEGMVICIEPILTIDRSLITGKAAKIVKEGEWNTRAENGSLVCHWEHTIYIGPNGPEILTLREEEK
jgi:methionyl aminopeptidase